MARTFKELIHLQDILGAYDTYKHCMYMPTKEKYEININAWLSDENIKICACLECGVIQGVIVISLQGPKKAEIVGISVNMSARGKGIGSYMILKVEEEYDIEMLYAETDDDAVTFYESNGFTITRLTKNYNGQDVVRYSCALKV